MKRLLLYTLLLISLTACTRRKHYTIGVSQCCEDIWREKLNDELLSNSYLYDNVKMVFESANDNDRRQIEQIDKFVKQGVDLLIVSPNKYTTITPAIERAYRKGIPVVLLDRKINSHHYASYIGGDNYQMGRQMAAWLARRTQGHARIAEIHGLQGSTSESERHRGFTDELKKHPDMLIVDERWGDWQPKSARVAMDSTLRRGVDFDCVFGMNDRMTIAARNLIEERGIDRHIIYIGIDALPVPGGGIDNVRDGRLDATYVNPTRGDLIMQLAMDILEGEPYEKLTTLDGALVTRENVDVMKLQADELSRQSRRMYRLHSLADMYLTQYSHQRIYLLLVLVIALLLVAYFVLLWRSVTLKRRMTEKNTEAKVNFFTNVSHEFRTPLTLISAPVEQLLADGQTTPQQQRLLQLVHKNVNVMLRLVGEILDFRKVQSGKMQLHLQHFRLDEALAQWTELFRPSAQRRNISLSLNAPTCDITADYHKVERVVYNLLGNALKYTPDGGHVDVALSADAHKACISVTDDGIGMTHEQLRHVFDTFYQAHGDTNGTGIGLAIVKAFAELHHGEASVASCSGCGSTFSVTLPLSQAGALTDTADCRPDADSAAVYTDTDDDTADAGRAAARAEALTSADGMAEQRPVVLVIDDNGDVRDYVASLLAPHYDVATAADGEEGVAKAQKEVPDIVVSDVMMPGIDGLEVCRRLKASMPTSHVPVVLLTARSMADQQADGYDCGADAYITKPFNAAVLQSCVRNLLDTRRRLKALYAGEEPAAETPRLSDADNRFMQQFRDIVDRHLSESQLSVEDVSRELGLSRVQMYRKLKALTGYTAVELVRIIRLKKADQMLRQGGRTVSEVAYEVGFSSPSYFAKCFKEHFGRQPSNS